MKNLLSKFGIIAIIGVLTSFVGCSSNKETAQPVSLSELLPLFTAENVPEEGSQEDVNLGGPFNWISDSTTQSPDLPGGGLVRYPMIYIGEGYNRIFIVNEGKVVWKYDTGEGNELDDIWMLKNGDLLFTRMYWAAKISPDKQQLWRYDCKPGEEIHTIQPVGEEEAVMLINAHPARLVRFNHNKGDIIWEKEIKFEGEGSHGQSRRMRVTKDNTLLLCYLTEHKVVEYSLDTFEPIREFKYNQPWAAIRLNNDNTLITLENERRTIEVDKNDSIVWEISLDDIPEQYRLADCQSVCRLQNGNTILCSRGNGGKSPQLVEVTPQKEVVWVVNDWKNFGPATSVQILSEKGFSENPGDLER